MREFRFEKLDSTNRFLMDFAKSELVPSFCIVEQQTSGYGQRQRSWVSHPGSITCSILLPFSTPCHFLEGLSQQVAICVHRLLSENTSKALRLKWPNDIYLNDKKVSGILIEVAKCSADSCWLVIGVGINSGRFTLDDRLMSAGYLDLSLDTKDQLISALRQSLLTLSKDWGASLMAYERDYWVGYDYFLENETVLVTLNNVVKEFIYLGLTDKAEIVTALKDNINERITFSHGQVSIRKQELP